MHYRPAHAEVDPSLASDVATRLTAFARRFGLNAVEVADVMEDVDDVNHYPSPGLVRTMMAGRQTPSVRFSHLLDLRLGEIEAQLEAGISSLVIAGKVRRVFRVTAKRHVMTILRAEDLHFGAQDAPEIVEAIQAAESVPETWIRNCSVCGHVFVARSSRMHVCRRQDDSGRYPCVREHNRRIRASRKAANLAALKSA